MSTSDVKCVRCGDLGVSISCWCLQLFNVARVLGVTQGRALVVGGGGEGRGEGIGERRKREERGKEVARQHVSVSFNLLLQRFLSFGLWPLWHTSSPSHSLSSPLLLLLSLPPSFTGTSVRTLFGIPLTGLLSWA